MKKLESCQIENCIPTPTSCSEWNGGDIEYLGICNGDSLNQLLLEIISKLQEITGEDLSQFDLDSLLDICNQKAPTQVDLLHILNILKQNQLCLKDFIDTLSEQISSISNTDKPSVNLKCYEQFDNLGNSLSITRNELDQLVINQLCEHENRLDNLEGKVINLQEQINTISSNTTVDELNFSTCIDGSTKPTSSQVISVANALCNLRSSNGDSLAISTALSKKPATDNARYGAISGWVLAPVSWAEDYGNLLLKVANLESRIIFMENNCCALSCEDIKLGFSAVFNEDKDGIIISFTWGAGTSIPSGFTDGGTSGTIKDIDGNSYDFVMTIANNSTTEVPISGLNLGGDISININAVLTNGTLTCQKCVTRVVKNTGCGFCQITNSGTSGSVIILFTSSTNVAVNSYTYIQDTTTTTTTTTIAP